MRREKGRRKEGGREKGGREGGRKDRERREGGRKEGGREGRRKEKGGRKGGRKDGERREEGREKGRRKEGGCVVSPTVCVPLVPSDVYDELECGAILVHPPSTHLCHILPPHTHHTDATGETKVCFEVNFDAT